MDRACPADRGRRGKRSSRRRAAPLISIGSSALARMQVDVVLAAFSGRRFAVAAQIAAYEWNFSRAEPAIFCAGKMRHRVAVQEGSGGSLPPVTRGCALPPLSMS